jgi:carboxyl-terminal processing protease
MLIKIPRWLLLSICAFFLSQGSKMSETLFEYAKNLEIFSELYKELGTNYVDEVEPGKLMKTGIDAMLKSLDPYTIYFSEYQAEEALMDRQGQYGGVGCKTIIRNNYPVVVEIMDGFAFSKAGIQIGDIITQYNGNDLKGKTTDELMILMRGAPNTSFTITVQRQNKTLSKTITRMVIKTSSVSFNKLLPNNIAYVKLEEFDQSAAAEIEKSLKEMMTKTTLKGVVLDLRDNGGGLLDQAVKIVGLFVGENQLVVNLKGQNPQGPKNWITPNKAILPNTPLVVLINGRSASASEVVSGSLQDLDRAVIMGQTSFGKGLVQNYISLPYRTQMKITTAKYYTPSGRCIQRLNYDQKDDQGNATTKSTNQKLQFKTKNGRLVLDGGGIDPDVQTDAFQGSELLKWLIQNNVLFDWCNQWATIKTDTTNFVISTTEWQQFLAFAAKQSTSVLAENWKKSLGKSEIYPTQLKPFESNEIKNNLIKDLEASKASIQYQLISEIMQRKLSRSSYLQQYLSLDSELKQAQELLLNSENYNRILKP